MEFIRKYDMEFLLNLEQEFLPVLADIELEGQWLDTKKWKELAETNKIALKKVEKHLDKLISRTLLKDLSKLGVKYGREKKGSYTRPKDLFNEVRIIPKKKIKQRRLNHGSHTQIKALAAYFGERIESTKEEAILEYLKTNPKTKLREYLNGLLVFREYNKLVSTYGDSFLEYINPVTGKIHTQFTQCWTSTGRLSSGDEKDDDGRKAKHYVNFQNLPKSNKYRNCFIALPGRKIVTIDYSNCELRVLAANSQDKVLLDNFNAGGDFHGYLGLIAYKLIYDKEATTCPKWFRTKMKTVNFAICYGATGYRISKYLDIPKSLGEQIYRNMRDMLPAMFNTLDSYEQFARKNGYIISDSRTKRRRWFGEYLAGQDFPDYKMRTESMNYPIQSVNASLVKEACVEIVKAGVDAKLISLIHDEILADVPADRAEDITKELKHIMEQTANRYLSDNVQMVAEPQIRDYWNK